MWIFSLFLLLTSLDIEAQDCGVITRTRGTVEVLRVKANDDSHTRIAFRALKNSSLQCNDIIVTGKSSRANLKLKGRGGIVAMGPFSRLEIETFKSGITIESAKNTQTLKLLYGKVRAFIEKDSQQKKEEDGTTEKHKSPTKKDLSYKFLIKTPSAVAGVRGTDFWISHNPNTAVTEQATIEGAVEISRTNPGTAISDATSSDIVEVHSGFQVTVATAVTSTTAPTESPELKSTSKLIARPIVPQVLDEIRQTSVLVQNEKNFSSKKAVEVLGEPENWIPPPDELPLDLKDLKEEF